MSQPGPLPEHHHFVQAPIAPLDEDGVNATIAGTAGFAVATLICLLNRDWLAAHGHTWWTHMCVTGTVLGLLGIAYCLRRRRVRISRGNNRDV